MDFLTQLLSLYSASCSNKSINGLKNFTPGRGLLPQAGLSAPGHKAGEHPADGPGAGEAVRLRLRQDAQSRGELHGLRGHQVV